MSHIGGPVVLKEHRLCSDTFLFQLDDIHGALLWLTCSCLGMQLASKACLGVPVVYLLGYQLAKLLLGKKNKDTNLLIFSGSDHRSKLFQKCLEGGLSLRFPT